MTKTEFYKVAMAILIPRLMCSVSDRYSKLSLTKAASTLPSLNLEGDAHIVAYRIADRMLSFFGNTTNEEAQEQFLQEAENLPLPEWYDKSKFNF